MNAAPDRPKGRDPAVYVLESFYEAPRVQVAEAFRSLFALTSLVAVDPALLLRPIAVYETDRLDFAEATRWRAPRAAASAEVASFDRSIDRV